MKKQFISLVCLFFLGLSVFNVASADTSVHLTIKTPGSTIYNQDILVSPCDSDHLGTMKITPYCGILQSGISSDWNWDWAPSAFLNSLGGVAGYTSKDKDNNDVYHFWSWSLNGAEAWDALNQYELQAGDLIALDFIDPGNSLSQVFGGQGLVEEKDKPGSVADAVSASPNSNIEAVTSEVKISFDQNKAIDFLTSQQKENGSFGNEMLTDWSTLALASGHDSTSIINLVKYFTNSEMSNPSLTDIERRAMTLMSLGLNPYNTYKENYISKILNSFDGKQFGDKNEDNDDIFALIVLKNVGYTKEDKVISTDMDFVISRQRENGSWDNSVDMTGVGILALSNFVEKNAVLSDARSVLIQESLAKARNFLKKEQKSDGGWGNVFSTAWAIEGILALGENPSDWSVGEDSGFVVFKNPLDYLRDRQDVDGGIKNDNLQNKIWETAYAISTTSQKTWNQIMQNFDKQTSIKKLKVPMLAENNENSVGSVLGAVSEKIENSEPASPSQGWFGRFFNFIFSF